MRVINIFPIICVLAVGGCVNRNSQIVTVSGPRLAVANLSAIEGRTINLNFAAEVNPDCTVRGEPVVQIVEAPANGAATITKVRDYTSFVPLNQRANCNKTKTPGIRLEYRSNPGFSGVDSVVADTIFSGGATTRIRYNIAVR